jgi:hypothetical protein
MPAARARFQLMTIDMKRVLRSAMCSFIRS